MLDTPFGDGGAVVRTSSSTAVERLCRFHTVKIQNEHLAAQSVKYRRRSPEPTACRAFSESQRSVSCQRSRLCSKAQKPCGATTTTSWRLIAQNSLLDHLTCNQPRFATSPACFEHVSFTLLACHFPESGDIVKRREFIFALGGGATACLRAAQAQRPAIPVVGWLDSESQQSARESILRFDQGLAETGFAAGRNLVVEYLWADGRTDRLPALAADLVRRRVAVIVALTTPSALAAKAATPTIPIVFRVGANPVEIGLVASFSHPAGNLTGVANLSSDITAKRLALLRELTPTVGTIAMLVNPTNSTFTAAETRDLQSVAHALGVRIVTFNGETESDIAAAFEALVQQQAGALLISADSFFLAERDAIRSLADRHAIPTMFFDRASVASGGLLSYGPDLLASNRQVGIYTGRILRGEKPTDLPVVQTTKFELVVNLKTAKALGLHIPDRVMALADEVIE
jgi:putative tryptophan/tyrosine transport system substrate-binding protein